MRRLSSGAVRVHNGTGDNDINAKKILGFFGIGQLVRLYTAFVVQCLWNWFAVRALNVPEVPYWTVFGLLILLDLVQREQPDVSESPQWRSQLVMLEACVPDDKRPSVVAAIKAQTDNMWTELGYKAIGAVIGKLFSNTLALVTGWAIYTLFV